MEIFSPIQEGADEALCALAAAGDRMAEGELVKRYHRLVRACARPCFLVGGDGQDLIQEGMIGLLSAIRSFDADKGAQFRTYAEACIRNRIRTAMRSAGRDKHTPLNTSISLADVALKGEPAAYLQNAGRQSTENPEDVIIDREEYDRRMETLLSQLSGFEKQVLDLYLDGLSYGEIAAKVGKPFKSVDNAVQRIRRKATPHITPGEFSVS